MVEYSTEQLDSWHKHVYQDVVQGRKKGESGKSSGESMTKAQAREFLQVEEGCNDAAIIKRAYRKKSFEFHPDRFIGNDRTEEEIKTGSDQFHRVNLSLETLASGVRGELNADGSIRSWYESLGGKDRLEFSGSIDLMSVDEAGKFCNKAFRSAVTGLSPDLTMSFVTRNQAATV